MVRSTIIANSIQWALEFELPFDFLGKYTRICHCAIREGQKSREIGVVNFAFNIGLFLVLDGHVAKNLVIETRRRIHKV
jgi:hypothetical protein